jgi:hypothetical protein
MEPPPLIERGTFELKPSQMETWRDMTVMSLNTWRKNKEAFTLQLYWTLVRFDALLTTFKPGRRDIVFKKFEEALEADDASAAVHMVLEEFPFERPI